MNNERIIFLKLFAYDFLEAEEIVAVLNHYRKNDDVWIRDILSDLLLRNLIVAYAKPFAPNKGTSEYKKWLTKEEVVPIGSFELHDLLMNQRNANIAHTDIKPKSPTLIKIETHDGKNVFPLSRLQINYAKSLLPRLPQIVRLIADVKKNLEQIIERLEPEINLEGIQF